MFGSGWIATFLMFAAWLLQLFTIIGGLNNLPFLNEIYYSRAQSGNQATVFNLWNSCQEQPVGTVTSCSPTQAAYDWSSQAPYNTVPGLSGHKGLFLALSITTWIAFGITTLTLLCSLCTHCCCRRKMSSHWFDFNHFWWTLIAWLAQLAAFILALVIGIRGGYLISHHISGTSTSLGPSTWMSLGALAALTLALAMYCCGFCCGRRRRSRQTTDQAYADQAAYNEQPKTSRGFFGRKKQQPVDPAMAYNNNANYGAPTGGAFNNPASGAAYNAENDVRV
jgi:hypothetical protein